MQDAYITCFPKGGYTIDINPCSDLIGPAVCEYILQYVSKLTCNVLLVFEKEQKVRGMEFWRPHAHLLLDVSPEEGRAIAQHFTGLQWDVDHKALYNPRGKCWYLGKDERGDCYRTIHPIPRKASTPAVPQQQAADDGSDEENNEDLSCYEPTEVVIWVIREENYPSVPFYSLPMDNRYWVVPLRCVAVARSEVNLTTLLATRRCAMPRAP